MKLPHKKLLVIAAILLFPFSTPLRAEEAGTVAVDLLFNPFCSPSLQSIQLLLGPLKPLLDEEPRVQFTVIPVMLGESARERKTLAALLCQIRRIGTYPGLLLVAGEVKRSLTTPNPDLYRFSWDRSRPGSECSGLAEFEREVDEIRRAVKVGDWPGTPTLYVEGTEVVIDPETVRSAIKAALQKGNK